MRDFLASKKNSFGKSGIISFPNGISEKTLRQILENIKSEIENEKREESAYENLSDFFHFINPRKIKNEVLENEKSEILLYVCTLSPVSEREKSFWAGGEEISKNVFESFSQTKNAPGLEIQIIYDSDRNFVSDETFENDSSSEEKEEKIEDFPAENSCHGAQLSRAKKMISSSSKSKPKKSGELKMSDRNKSSENHRENL